MDHSAEFEKFARELSRNLSLISTLLTEHPPEGRCTGCRAPGSQRPVWAPCGCRAVALAALKVRALEEEQAAEAADDALITFLGGGGVGDDDLTTLLSGWRADCHRTP